MLNNSGSMAKYQRSLVVPNTTGVFGDEGSISAEVSLRVEVTGGALTVIKIEVAIIGSSDWTVLDTITGPSKPAPYDISTWDKVRYNVTTANGVGAIVASGFITK